MREINENLKEALETDFEKYPSLNPNIVENGTVIAQNSHFYNQIMMDGYVFNPYIHRRWLPRQFRELLNKSRRSMFVSNFCEYIKNHTEDMYWNKFVNDELNKLINLNRYDVKAFKERSKFFTVDIIKLPYVHYVTGFLAEAEKLRNVSISGRFNVIIHYMGYSFVVRSKKYFCQMTDGTFKISALYYDKLEEAKARIENATVYSEIKAGIEILNELGIWKCFNYIPFDDDVKEKLIYAYVEEGAYYTIKDALMFRGATFRGKTGAEGCQLLKHILNDYATDLIYAAALFYDYCRMIINDGY